ALKRALGVLVGGGHASVLAQHRRQRRQLDRQVVNQLVKLALWPEVVGGGVGEGEGVGDVQAARVVSDQQDWALGWDPLQPPDVRTEVKVDDPLVERKRLADEVGVTLVE